MDEQVTSMPATAPVQTEVVSQPPVVAPAADNSDTFALVAIILGIMNLCSWLLPIVGCPMAIITFIVGSMGLKSKKYKTFVIIALVVSGLSLLATIGNSALGVIIALRKVPTN